MVQILRDHYYKFIVVFLLFLLLSFDQDLAMIYILIMIADYIWYKSDNFVSFHISKGKLFDNPMVYIEALAGLGLFVFLSTFLVTSFHDPAASLTQQAQSLFDLLATSTPLLKDSKVLTFVGWVFLVPIIETVFFAGRLLEGLASYAEVITGKKISLERFSGPLFVVIFIVSALFTLFHITAKGLETVPLLITFLFMVISCMLVIRHRQLKGAIAIHIITNGVAVLSLSQFGVL